MASDEVERSLLRTCRGWEKAHGELWVRVQVLTIERDEARTEIVRLLQKVTDGRAVTDAFAAEIERLKAENAALRAAAVEGREP